MAKPAILLVDDDADVLRAIERDVRRHFGNALPLLGMGERMTSRQHILVWKGK